MNDARGVARHYGRPELSAEILQALQDAGKDINRLTLDDLMAIDELHTLGRQSTIDLARVLAVRSTDQVLDLGCGIGGPSRYLAKTFGCRVTGIDLTLEFCAAAGMLTRLTELNDLVDYQQADALALPFADCSFDVVWSQNVVMNIVDRSRLYREVHRVLKPEGRYGFAEVVAGNGEPYFPLPWALEPSISILVPTCVTREQLTVAGLDLAVFEDRTADVLSRRQTTAQGSRGALGMLITMGPDGPERIANAGRSYAEGRMRFVQGVAVRRG